MTRIQRCNWRVFAILGLGDFNDELPFNGLRLGGRERLQ